MEKIILIFIIIFLLLIIFHQKNLIHKLKLKNEALKIAYDDYSAYQKSYINYYKWLFGNKIDKDKSICRYTLLTIRMKLREYFIHCEKE